MSEFEERLVWTYGILLIGSWVFSFALSSDPHELAGALKEFLSVFRWVCLLPVLIVGVIWFLSTSGADPPVTIKPRAPVTVNPPPQPIAAAAESDWMLAQKLLEVKRTAEHARRKKEEEESEQRRMQEKLSRSAEAATQETLDEF